jgi:hypothetical protein
MIASYCFSQGHIEDMKLYVSSIEQFETETRRGVKKNGDRRKVRDFISEAEIIRLSVFLKGSQDFPARLSGTANMKV